MKRGRGEWALNVSQRSQTERAVEHATTSDERLSAAVISGLRSVVKCARDVR